MAKLMLVEDDNNLREIYQARLQAEGYTIASARDGEEALVMVKSDKPDLIISDVMMPKISGFEMLDILRNTEGLKDVKVIMLTALGQGEDQQRADKLGADRYLVKSQVTLEDIVKAAHDLLQDTPVEPAPAVAPVPVASIPAPAEPTTVPAPTTTPAVAVVAEPASTVATPPVEPAAASAADAIQPNTEASETANMEEKIENFVAGASEDASVPLETTPQIKIAVEPAAAESVATPVADPTPAPETDLVIPSPELVPVASIPAPAEPTTVPAPTTTPAVAVVAEPASTVATPPVEIVTPPEPAPVITNTADDTVVSNSTERLGEANPGANDDDKSSGSPSTVLPSMVTSETVTPQVPADIDNGNDQPTETPTSESTIASASHKTKVITPTLPDPNQKNITELLAEEELKENPQSASEPNVVSGSDQANVPE